VRARGTRRRTAARFFKRQCATFAPTPDRPPTDAGTPVPTVIESSQITDVSAGNRTVGVTGYFVRKKQTKTKKTPCAIFLCFLGVG